MMDSPTRRRFLASTGIFAGMGMFPALAESANDRPRTAEDTPPHQVSEAVEIPPEESKPLGWAVVGLGSLALGQIMPAFKDCKLAKPVALVSGHPDKAAKVAAQYGIESNAIFSYENYDEIVADPRIDVVYIVLPNSMHAEFTIRALKAGKHVYCEKPMAASAEEGASMAAAAQAAGKKLGVAYRLHYEPLTRQAMEWCRAQKFGPLRTFTSSNCQNVDAPNIRLSRELAGGPLGDIGIYCINAARYMIGEEPVEVGAFFNQPSDDPRFKEVPASFVFSMKYPSGVLATCDCAFNSGEARFFEVHCGKGTIRMESAFAYRGLKLTGKDPGGSVEPEGGQNSVNQFAAEMDAFSKAVIENGEVLTPAAMGIADMKIIAAINEAAASGKIVKVLV